MLRVFEGNDNRFVYVRFEGVVGRFRGLKVFRVWIRSLLRRKEWWKGWGNVLRVV